LALCASQATKQPSTQVKKISKQLSPEKKRSISRSYDRDTTCGSSYALRTNIIPANVIKASIHPSMQKLPFLPKEKQNGI